MWHSMSFCGMSCCWGITCSTSETIWKILWCESGFIKSFLLIKVQCPQWNLSWALSLHCSWETKQELKNQTAVITGQLKSAMKQRHQLVQKAGINTVNLEFTYILRQTPEQENDRKNFNLTNFPHRTHTVPPALVTCCMLGHLWHDASWWQTDMIDRLKTQFFFSSSCRCTGCN